ncbi:MAG: glycine--tRNA ligase subunit beta [Deltaproteobacteria bacterium]|nr:glycine--tRNA ligase subunit beta [Deltaproteobacteria bacterium]
MDSLLLEIGTEELPAGYIEPALRWLSSNLSKKLNNVRIEHGDIKTYATPLRLAVLVKNVHHQQKPQVLEITGPPKDVGFRKDGSPTVAAEKFAEKAGIPVNKIQIKQTPKGMYLFAEKVEKGVASKTLLKEILPEIILAIPFPKTMRWADLSISFARPIQSILAILGGSTISFEVGNIKSSGYSFGHRFTHPGRIKIPSPEKYVDLLAAAGVLVDKDRRRNIIVKEISKIAKKLGGIIVPDEELIDIVIHLVEYPVVMSGEFDKTFLELPDEVLITAMREHQKYFAVKNKTGQLLPNFIVVNNTRVKKIKKVAKGHERVLRARLADAKYFYANDINESMDMFVDKLKGIIFQAKLGSLYEKVERVQKIAIIISDQIGGGDDLRERVSRASWLSKADLVSQVVNEFPKLQGVMGRIYAQMTEESKNTAIAIEEHYQPTYSGGPLPETMEGAILAVADKMDSICGCFSVDLIPTGASDPYALRRQGIGILQIMSNKGFTFSLKKLIENSVELFKDKCDKDMSSVAQMVYDFLKDRVAHLLAEEGFAKDTVSAVISVSIDNVPDVWKRASALKKLRLKPDFEPLAITFKRVVNIIKKTDEADIGDVDPSLFQDNSETALNTAYEQIKENVFDNLGKGEFDQALLDIASLRDSVDTFFDNVLVMEEDVSIRRNRLGLLRCIENVADFSKIST